MTRQTILAALLLYALVYATCRALDIDHCQAHGAEYAGTSLSLEGFCNVSGDIMPAELLSR